MRTRRRLNSHKLLSMKDRGIRRCLTLLLCLVLGGSPLATTAYGQTYQGGLRGAAHDATGAVIVGAQLKLINEETSVERATTTNSDGEYSFANVLPGTYTLSATHTGFKKAEYKGIRIGTQTFITLDVSLEVGSTNEEVQISGGGPILENSNASVASSLDNKTLDTLPTAGRNPFFLSVTVPNVIPTGDPQFVRQQDQTNSSLLSLGGGPRRGNNYLIEGVAITDMRNRAVIIPSIEAVDEVKVQVSTYDAEIGRTGGGIFNTTFKSGSNDWHGSAVYQNRPAWGLGLLYFARKNKELREAAGLPFVKPESYFHLYGGSFGGRIFKNRTFFFATTEGYKTLTSRSETLILPTDRERNGDFSQSGINIFNPLTTRTVGGKLIRDQFQNNMIPSGMISQVARNTLKLLPLPTSGHSLPATAGLIDRANQFTVKIDHKVSSKDTLTGSLSYYKSREPETVFFGGPADPGGGALFRTAHIIAINNIYTLSSNTVMSFRYGFTRFTDNDVPETFDPATLGFSQSFVSAIIYKKFPDFAVSGYGQSRFDLTGDRDPQDTTYYGHNANASFSKLFGRHTLKFGADFRIIGMKLFARGQPSGIFSFTKAFTQGPDPNVASSTAGDAIASFLLGFPATGRVPVATPNDFYINYYGGFVHDDFRISRKLTVNAGLRYEFEQGLQERDKHITVGFSRDAPFPVQVALPDGRKLVGGLLYAGVDGQPTHQADPSKTKFAPRVGFAWSMNNKTIFRGGYGIFWAPTQYPFPSENSMGTRGFTAVTTFFSSADGGLTPADRLDNPFPNGIEKPVGSKLGLLTGAGGDVHFIDQFGKSAYVQQYSVDVQRQIRGDIAFTLGYVGSRSTHLGVGGTVDSTVNINQLDPKYQSLGTSLQDRVPNPFFGNSAFGALSTSSTIARGQLLRPFPQFGNVLAHRVTQGTARYNAFMVKAVRRIRNGWGMNINYTLSRINDSQFGESNFFANRGGGALNSFDLDREFSRSLLDTPHRLNISGTVELPFGRGKRWLDRGGVVNALLGGWAVTAIGSYQSGFPIGISQASNNSGLFGSNQRPNLNSGANAKASDAGSFDPKNSWVNWLDPAAWKSADPFTFGNAPRVDPRVRTPFKKNWDIAFQKTQSIGERKSVMARAEMINIFDNPNFIGPSTSLGSGNFGKITAVGGFPRMLQLTFRFAF
ncbi:MAG TPA: TonB-dependent receptor [Blastocatellia bacterium]